MKPIRFAIAQLNPIVGNFELNTRKIQDAIRSAEQKGADIIVFPEMALCGYPVWDLANKKSFIDEGLKSLDRIIAGTKSLKITAALGYINHDKKSKGRSQNAMAWISKGKLAGRYIKRLLPTYDVFLEQIFFNPGQENKVFTWRGIKIGPTICEDIWDEQYTVKPLRDLVHKGADVSINISASPFYRGVAAVRDRLLTTQSRKHKLPMLYVNQVGGQDDLIFDGRSLFVDENGKILFRAPAFEEGVFYFDWNPSEKQPKAVSLPLRGDAIAEVYDALVLGVRDYCQKNNFKKVVIGLSGGIDSALVAAIATDALGPDAVLGVTMPSSYSSTGSWKDSEDLAERLGIICLKHPIKAKYELFIKEHRDYKFKETGVREPEDKISLAMENLQARFRGMELMFISNDEGRLVLTTGNKSELAMGYCTLYGDMAGGLSVIGDVFKTDVYRLVDYRNKLKQVIPRSIVEKAPTAELRPNQKDQDSLPPYDILDDILFFYIEENKSVVEITRILQPRYPKVEMTSLVKKVVRHVDHNEYKRRQTPPILRVTRKAWFGRRMPITNQFEH